MRAGKRLGKQRPRCEAGLDQVAARQAGPAHPLVIECEHVPELPLRLRVFCTHGFPVAARTDAAQVIRPGEQQQILRAEGTVVHLHVALDGGAAVDQHVRLHMKLRHIQHILHELCLPRHAPQKGLYQRQARLLMLIGVEHTANLLRCDRLAHIVAQGGQHEAQRLFRPGAKCGCLVQYLHGVDPDVALGVKSGVLPKSDQGFKLRKPDRKLPHFPKLLKEDRRPFGFQQRLFQLSHDALPRQGF